MRGKSRVSLAAKEAELNEEAPLIFVEEIPCIGKVPMGTP